MPSIASVACWSAIASFGGTGSSVLMSRRDPAAPSATIEASATTRRDPDSAASTGTTTSQIAAKEPRPPVEDATVVTSPVSANDDSTWALSYWPARDRK